MKETLKYVLMDASIEFDLFVIGRNALVYMFERVSSPLLYFISFATLLYLPRQPRWNHTPKTTNETNERPESCCMKMRTVNYFHQSCARDYTTQSLEPNEAEDGARSKMSFEVQGHLRN